MLNFTFVRASQSIVNEMGEKMMYGLKIDLIFSDSTKNSHWKLYSVSLERQMALSHPVLVHGRVALAYVILWWCQ